MIIRICLTVLGLITVLWSFVSRDVCIESMKARTVSSKDLITLSQTWHVLGPFQIGTREAAWGADPLEAFGGFQQLLPARDGPFRSSLTANATTGWSEFQLHDVSQTHQGVSGSLTVQFPEIDWPFLRRVYGWAASQYQAWARGSLTLKGRKHRNVVLFIDNVLEFRVDKVSYFGGDMYARRKAPLVLRLAPGVHQIDIRLVRDVRAMGDVQDIPEINIRIEGQISSKELVTVDDKHTLPDIVNGRLASNLASLTLRNQHQERITITGLTATADFFHVSLKDASHVELASGQTRPLAFIISLLKPVDDIMSVSIEYSAGQSQLRSFLLVTLPRLRRTSIHEPHRFTFFHPSGILSHAVLRAPSLNATSSCHGTHDLPILLNLHGAGLDADNDAVAHALDPLPDLCSWVLFPSGVTPWSGDDWHTWGFADVKAAIAAIPHWIKTTGWTGPGVDLDRWFVGGHSNGGQGSWHILTHEPDKVMAAAPVSGYLSIPAYVPYQFWTEADPRLSSIVQSSMNDFNHQLLASNVVGIPVLAQHGSNDDNVPAYHSRRMSELIARENWEIEYHELAGMGHWFKGVMTTTGLREFYRTYLGGESAPPSARSRAEAFTVTAANPHTMGPNRGIIIDQLVTPDQYGKIRAIFDASTSCWQLKTSNVHRLRLERRSWGALRDRCVKLDGQRPALQIEAFDRGQGWFVRSRDGHWQWSNDASWQTPQQRCGRQLGGMDALLSSRGPFTIVTASQGAEMVALQISRNLMQYLGADSCISGIGVHGAERPGPSGRQEALAREPHSGTGAAACSSADHDARGNLLVLLLGSTPPPARSESDNHPVRIILGEGGMPSVHIQDHGGFERRYLAEPGLGVLFLRPLADERLELIVWGFDEQGLRAAARLVPTMTGTGQPDFVVLSAECASKGVAGVQAMGFFDSFWRVTSASYFT